MASTRKFEALDLAFCLAESDLSLPFLLLYLKALPVLKFSDGIVSKLMIDLLLKDSDWGVHISLVGVACSVTFNCFSLPLLSGSDGMAAKLMMDFLL